MTGPLQVRRAPSLPGTLALTDDIVTAEEDEQIGRIVDALGLTWDQIRRAHPELPIHPDDDDPPESGPGVPDPSPRPR